MGHVDTSSIAIERESYIQTNQQAFIALGPFIAIAIAMDKSSTLLALLETLTIDASYGLGLSHSIAYGYKWTQSYKCMQIGQYIAFFFYSYAGSVDQVHSYKKKRKTLSIYSYKAIYGPGRPSLSLSLSLSLSIAMLEVSTRSIAIRERERLRPFIVVQLYMNLVDQVFLFHFLFLQLCWKCRPGSQL